MLMKMKGRSQNLLGIALGVALVAVLLLVTLNLMTTPEGARDLRCELIELVDREIVSAEDPEAAAEAAGMTEKQLRKWKQFIKDYADGDWEFLMEDLTEQLPEGYADQIKARKLEDVIVLMPGKTLTRLSYGELDLAHEPLGRTVSEDFPLVAGICVGVAAVALALCAWLIRGGSRPLWIGMFLGVVIAVALLALAFFVPSSPPILVDVEVQKHFTMIPAECLMDITEGEIDVYSEFVGPSLTYYGAWLAVAATIGVIWTACRYRSQGRNFAEGAMLAVTCGAAALVCSHLLYCLTNWNYIRNTLGTMSDANPITPWKLLAQPWLGGYTMFGAIFGGILAAFVWARVSRHSFSGVMDALVPGMLVLLLLGRYAEIYTAQGLASDRVKETLHMLPFNTNRVDEWEYVMPVMQVFAYEAAAAGIALIAALEVRGSRAPDGRAAETGLAIVSAAQVMLDSWRNDELIKFGFVRLNMIMAAMVLAFILVTRMVRVIRSKGLNGWCIARALLFIVSAVAVIGVEFGLDGKFGITASSGSLYTLQMASVVVMCLSVLIQDGRTAADMAPASAPEEPEEHVPVKA